MRRILFLSVGALLLSGFCNESRAQGAAATRGSFEMSTAGQTAPLQASYSITPAGADNVVLQLTPDKPFTLNARIVDKQGKVMQAIPTEDVGLRYAQSIDVSKLAPGEYFIEVLYGDKSEKNYRIPFTK
jgi:hypothetical protein